MSKVSVHFDSTYSAARWLALRSEIIDALHSAHADDYSLDVSFTHGTNVTVTVPGGDEAIAAELAALTRRFDQSPDPDSDYSSEGSCSPP